MLKRCQHYSNMPLISSYKIILKGVVSLLRRKPKFGSVGVFLRDLLGGGQFAPPMTVFFERFFHPKSNKSYKPISREAQDFLKKCA